MSKQADIPYADFADPVTEPFWRGCAERRLRVQRCADCGAHQFYPRPICLGCESERLDWVDTAGRGTIYSVTTVRVPVVEELKPPYLLALVDLDEGVRLLTNIVGDAASIGDRVEVQWRERDGLPPVPVFKLSTDRR